MVPEGYDGLITKPELNMDFLMHHGILGMKWGKQNGPPYPLGSGDHSASERKAGYKKSLGGGHNEEMYDRKKKFKAANKVATVPKKKKENTRSTKEELEDVNKTSNQKFSTKNMKPMKPKEMQSIALNYTTSLKQDKSVKNLTCDIFSTTAAKGLQIAIVEYKKGGEQRVDILANDKVAGSYSFDEAKRMGTKLIDDVIDDYNKYH